MLSLADGFLFSLVEDLSVLEVIGEISQVSEIVFVESAMDDVLFFDVVLEEWRCEFFLKLFDNAMVKTGGGFELVEFLLQFFGLKDVLVVG